MRILTSNAYVSCRQGSPSLQANVKLTDRNLVVLYTRWSAERARTTNHDPWGLFRPVPRTTGIRSNTNYNGKKFSLCFVLLSLSLFLPLPHAHAHSQREKERERERARGGLFLAMPYNWQMLPSSGQIEHNTLNGSLWSQRLALISHKPGFCDNSKLLFF